MSSEEEKPQLDSTEAQPSIEVAPAAAPETTTEKMKEAVAPPGVDAAKLSPKPTDGEPSPAKSPTRLGSTMLKFKSAVNRTKIALRLMKGGVPMRKGNVCFYAADPLAPLNLRWRAATILTVEELGMVGGVETPKVVEVKEWGSSSDSEDESKEEEAKKKAAEEKAKKPKAERQVTIQLQDTMETIVVPPADVPSKLHCNKSLGWAGEKDIGDFEGASAGGVPKTMEAPPDLCGIPDSHTATLAYSLGTFCNHSAGTGSAHAGSVTVGGQEGVLLHRDAVERDASQPNDDKKSPDYVKGTGLERSQVMMIGVDPKDNSFPAVTSFIQNRSDMPAVAAGKWSKFQKLLEAFCGNTCVLDVTLHQGGELTVRPSLADTTSSCPMVINSDLTEAMSTTGVPSNVQDQVQSLAGLAQKVKKISLPPSGLKGDAQDAVDKLGAALGVKNLTAYFYSKTVMNAAALDEARSALLQWLKTRMRTLAFKMTPTSAPVLAKLLAVPKKRNLLVGGPSGQYEDFLQANLRDHCLYALKKRSSEAPTESKSISVTTADGGELSLNPTKNTTTTIGDGGPAPVVVHSSDWGGQLGGIEAAMALVESTALGGGHEILIGKMVEAAAKEGAIPGALSMGKSSIAAPSVASSTAAASTPGSPGPSGALAGGGKPGKLNLASRFGGGGDDASSSAGSPLADRPKPGSLKNRFQQQPQEEPKPAPLQRGGGGRLGGAGGAASPAAAAPPAAGVPAGLAAKTPCAKGSAKDRDSLYILHPSDGGRPTPSASSDAGTLPGTVSRYTPAKWLALLKATQLFPNNGGALTPTQEYHQLIATHFPAPVASASSDAATHWPIVVAVILGQQDWNSGESLLLATELARCHYYTKGAVKLHVRDLTMYRHMLPQGFQTPGMSDDKLVRGIMETLPFEHFHFQFRASTGPGGNVVDLTVRAYDVLQERFMKYKGRPLAKICAWMASKRSERLVQRRRVMRNVLTIQMYARDILTSRIREVKERAKMVRLQREFFKTQQERLLMREGSSRDSLTQEEKIEKAYIMRQSGSFLTPLFQRVRQDFVLNEMEHRLKIKQLEIDTKNILLGHLAKDYSYFVDELHERYRNEDRAIRRQTEPLECEETLSANTLDRQECHARKKIMKQFEVERAPIQERQDAIDNKDRCTAQAQRLIVTTLKQSAVERYKEEQKVTAVLARPKEPYNVSYEQYWAQQDEYAAAQVAARAPPGGPSTYFEDPTQLGVDQSPKVGGSSRPKRRLFPTTSSLGGSSSPLRASNMAKVLGSNSSLGGAPGSPAPTTSRVGFSFGPPSSTGGAGGVLSQSQSHYTQSIAPSRTGTMKSSRNKGRSGMSISGFTTDSGRTVSGYGGSVAGAPTGSGAMMRHGALASQSLLMDTLTGPGYIPYETVDMHQQTRRKASAKGPIAEHHNSFYCGTI